MVVRNIECWKLEVPPLIAFVWKTELGEPPVVDAHRPMDEEEEQEEERKNETGERTESRLYIT